MGHNLTLKDVRDFFIELETKYETFSLNYLDIFYWKLVRMSVYSGILRQMGFVDESHPMLFKQKIGRIWGLMKYSLLNLFKQGTIVNSEAILLTGGRKYLHNGEFIDIHLDDIIKELTFLESDFLIIDRPDHYGAHKGFRYDNIIYFERLKHITRELYSRILIPKIKNIDMRVVHEIEAEIKRTIGVEIDIETMVLRRLFRFQLEKTYFDNIFDQVKPKELYLVCSYGKEEMIASAQERGIQVTEVQHGVLNDYHLGYSFPRANRIPYFPDKIILLGEYWQETTSFPLKTKLEVRSLSYYSDKNLEIKNNHRDQVLFVSQGPYGKDVSSIAAKFALHNNISCSYKLHPSEFSVWKSRYTDLYKSFMAGKIKVFADEMALYDLFDSYKYVIGVNSTALYEAVQRKCNVYALRLEGYQYLEDLAERGFVKLIEKNFDLSSLSEFTPSDIPNRRYFF